MKALANHDPTAPNASGHLQLGWMSGSGHGDRGERPASEGASAGCRERSKRWASEGASAGCRERSERWASEGASAGCRERSKRWASEGASAGCRERSERWASEGASAGCRERSERWASEGAINKVGPNAILQTGDTLREFFGSSVQSRIYRSAGLAHYLDVPPTAMVDEKEAARLFAAILEALPEEASRHTLEEAGRRTGDYILANRVPAAAQSLIRWLPAPLGARALLAAIAKHSWTFAGSGHVTCDYTAPLALSIADNPLATPGCPWHTAVLGRLFHSLVGPGINVHHVSCETHNCNVCRFEIG